MKKSLILAAGVLTLGMAMNAFAAEGTTIKWISQGPGEGSWETKTADILAKFEEETGIHVDAEFYSFNDLFEVIETKAASGNVDFDVMSVDVTYVAKYATSGYMDPLDSYFTDEEKAQFDEASFNAGIWDGQMYAAAMNTSAQVLWYNVDLLNEAGIEIPENDAEHRLTYQQVADLAKQALEKLDPDGSRGLVGFDFQQISRLYQMNMLPNSMGGLNIDETGYSLDGIINTQPWIDAMTWYQNLVNDGIASRGYDADALAEVFNSGNMIFMVGGTWTPTNMTCDAQIDCTYAPCFEGYEDQVKTGTGSWYFGLASASEKKDAAAEFIKFMSLGEGNDMWMVVENPVPSRLSLQEEMMHSENASKVMQIAAYEAAHTAFPRAVTPAFGEYSDVINSAWEDVRNGANVEDTLNYAVEQFASAVAAYVQ